MKTKSIFTALMLFIAGLSYAQELENLDFISPMYDGLSAVEKDGKWGFIDETGKMAIDFREDLVIAKSYGYDFPVFNNNRCLIKEVRKGISFFGYIDRSGMTVIKPQYINATPFIDGTAMVLALTKETPGSNDLLDKKLVYYKYYEALIDESGNVVYNLMEKPQPVTLDKEYLRKPPKFKHRLVGHNLYAKMNKDKSWSVIKIE